MMGWFRLPKAPRRVPPWLLALALAVPLAACSSDDQAAAPDSSADSGDFPNLGEVPDQTPESTPPLDRAALIQELAADRANAEYTDESLNESAANTPAALPPYAPISFATAQEPAASDDATEADETADATVAAADMTFVASLPTTAGDAVAMIYFAEGSIGLTDRDRAVLHDVARFHEKQNAGRMRVIGHVSAAEAAATADADGTALALARAQAVAAELVKQGLSASALETGTAIEAVAYDESSPTGAAANRRVEVLVAY